MRVAEDQDAVTAALNGTHLVLDIVSPCLCNCIKFWWPDMIKCQSPLQAEDFYRFSPGFISFGNLSKGVFTTSFQLQSSDEDSREAVILGEAFGEVCNCAGSVLRTGHQSIVHSAYSIHAHVICNLCVV